MKKGNRYIFINQLVVNIKSILSKYNILYPKSKSEGSLIFLFFELEKDAWEAFRILHKYLIGISIISIAKNCLKNIDQINSLIRDSISFEKITSFRVTVKRHDKKWKYNSNEAQILIGAEIVKNNPHLNVILKKPQLEVKIEIGKELCFVCIENRHGLNGLPPGVSGTGINMISGGIDSSVAAFQLLLKGAYLDYIHFFEENDNTILMKEKIITIVKKLNKYQPTHKALIYFVNISLIKNEIMCFKNKESLIMILKHFFYEISNHFIRKNNYKFLSNGESIGQVSSQTISNLNILSSNTVFNVNIFRPLITFNKMDIINISKAIGLYNISISKPHDLCDYFIIYKQSPNINKNSFKNEIEKNIYGDILEIIYSTNIKIITIN